MGGEGQREPGHEHLGGAEAEDGPAQDPQPAGLELEADDEEQEHDAELGEVQDVVDVGDEPQAPGSDQHAGGEVAEHGAEAELACQHDRDYGGGEVDRRVVKYHLDLLHGEGPPPSPVVNSRDSRELMRPWNA